MTLDLTALAKTLENSKVRKDLKKRIIPLRNNFIGKTQNEQIEIETNVSTPFSYAFIATCEGSIRNQLASVTDGFASSQATDCGPVVIKCETCFELELAFIVQDNSDPVLSIVVPKAGAANSFVGKSIQIFDIVMITNRVAVCSGCSII